MSDIPRYVKVSLEGCTVDKSCIDFENTCERDSLRKIFEEVLIFQTARAKSTIWWGGVKEPRLEFR